MNVQQKNLETMRAVTAKMKKMEKRSESRKSISETDGDYNPQLAYEEIQSILRDERLIGVAPKFIKDCD